MDRSNKFSDDMHAAASSALFTVVRELTRIIKEMAGECDPFPSFLSMKSIQAIELEPVSGTGSVGCIVVCPDGVLRHLDLVGISGGVEIADVEQVEQFEEVQLPPEQYLSYAIQAVDLLYAELRRRGK